MQVCEPRIGTRDRQKGPGHAEFDLYGGGDDVRVLDDADGREVTSDVRAA